MLWSNGGGRCALMCGCGCGPGVRPGEDVRTNGWLAR